jgi:hypothetical protein
MRSDHTSFWDVGYSALCSIESDFNPAYHTDGDTLGLLDPAFFTKVTKANIATLASLAGSKSITWRNFGHTRLTIHLEEIIME